MSCEALVSDLSLPLVKYSWRVQTMRLGMSPPRAEAGRESWKLCKQYLIAHLGEGLKVCEMSLALEGSNIIFGEPEEGILQRALEFKGRY